MYKIPKINLNFFLQTIYPFSSLLCNLYGIFNDCNCNEQNKNMLI
jgi:hypothetical protein